MTGSRSKLARFGSVVVLVTTFALAGVVWLVGTHDHAPSPSGHSCAVCTLAHSPAADDAHVPAIAAPRSVTATVVVHATDAPARIATGIAPSRAPPTT